MRDFTRHQKAQRIFHADIVGHVDQTLIQDFCTRFGSDVRTQVGGHFADGIDIRRSPWHASRVSQRRSTAVKQRGQMAVVTGTGNVAINLALFLCAFSQLTFRAFVQHTHQRTDDFQVAQLFRRDIHQHIFTAWIVIA